MHVRTRNKIITTFWLALPYVIIVLLIFSVYRAEKKVAYYYGAYALITLTSVTVYTSMKLREAGLRRKDLQLVEEKPLPIFPRLANNLQQLIVGILTIVLIIAAFILHWTGTFKKWFPE